MINSIILKISFILTKDTNIWKNIYEMNIVNKLLYSTTYKLWKWDHKVKTDHCNIQKLNALKVVIYICSYASRMVFVCGSSVCVCANTLMHALVNNARDAKNRWMSGETLFHTMIQGRIFKPFLLGMYSGHLQVSARESSSVSEYWKVLCICPGSGTHHFHSYFFN